MVFEMQQTITDELSDSLKKERERINAVIARQIEASITSATNDEITKQVNDRLKKLVANLSEVK